MNETEYKAALLRASEMDNDDPELDALIAEIIAYEQLHEPDYVEA